MKEIKFRAWDITNVSQPRMEYFNIGEGFSGLNECPIMQYTGLKDKNGKEIYDGDIIKWHEVSLVNAGEDIRINEGQGEIFWSEDFCHFGIKEIPHKLGHWTLSKDNLVEYEVIGNVYENNK